MSTMLLRSVLRRRPAICPRPVSSIRGFSQDQDNPPGRNLDWRKKQLDALERRFQDVDHAVNKIQDQEDLQPMWKEMEGRVSNRRSRTLAQNNGKIGRANIRKTDEDIWLQEGFYDGTEEEKKN